MQKLIVFSLSFITVVLVFYVLKTSEAIFVPFLIALAISYLIISLAEGIRRIPFNKRHLPRSLSFLIAILMIGVVMYVAGRVLRSNVLLLIESAPVYQERLRHLSVWIFDFFGVEMPDVTEMVRSFDLTSILTQVFIFLKDLASGAGIISIYIIFILMEYHFFDQKVVALFHTESGKESARKIIEKIGKQIQSYLRIKTVISFVTAVFSYILLTAVGVDFAEFWAFTIFFLNYIPTIGAIIATIFPCLLTLLQFQSWIPFAIVTGGLSFIHFLVGNLIEPKIMGSKFNLSGLVIIISLMVASELWGVAGMVLCVPLLMITSIVLSNFPTTRPIAVLLSQKGEIEK